MQGQIVFKHGKSSNHPNSPGFSIFQLALALNLDKRKSRIKLSVN